MSDRYFKACFRSEDQSLFPAQPFPDKLRITFVLLVLSRPFLNRRLLINQTKLVGENATIPCAEFSGIGCNLTFKWIKWNCNPKFKLLDNGVNEVGGLDSLRLLHLPRHWSKQYKQAHKTFNDLRFTNLRPEQSGFYTCYVENHFGSDYATMFLDVKRNKGEFSSLKGFQCKNTSWLQLMKELWEWWKPVFKFLKQISWERKEFFQKFICWLASFSSLFVINPFMHNVVKWPDILKQFCSGTLQNCFSMCGHFTTLCMKGLTPFIFLPWNLFNISNRSFDHETVSLEKTVGHHLWRNLLRVYIVSSFKAVISLLFPMFYKIIPLWS